MAKGRERGRAGGGGSSSPVLRPRHPFSIVSPAFLLFLFYETFTKPLIIITIIIVVLIIIMNNVQKMTGQVS